MNNKTPCEQSHTHSEVVVMRSNLPKEEEMYDLAEFFKVLGDSTRIKILFTLYKEPLCVCDIANVLGMSQSAISHQLRVLKQGRVVKHRKDGRTVYYSLDDEHIKNIISQGFSHTVGEC